MRQPILEAITKERLFFDGGTGSVLQERGLKPGELPELWNLTRPEDIVALHYEYYMAGANIVKTNTFGANSLKFDSDTQRKIITAAIQNAKKARDMAEEVDGSRNLYVALDLGPCGKLLKPLGDLDFSDAVNLFAEMIEIGAKEGCDLILIETMNDSYEAKAAVLAAKEHSNLPVFVTTVYDETAKLLTGANPAAMTALLEGLHVDAIGMNCSLGPKQMLPVVKELAQYTSLPIVVNPNAGLPRSEHGKTVYDVSVDEFAAVIKEMMEAGATIVGGCCGTTPEYIRKVVELCREIPVATVSEKNLSMISSHTHAVLFAKKPILIGERINPTGKSKLKQALREHNLDYLMQEGITQEEKGADVLDVNVGLPEIDEVSMMTEVVTQLQSITDLPLQIDTADPIAMEQALRVYNGKALVNSVNGKHDVMERIFPMVAKYGGMVVALTLDEDGIPDTAEGRIAIAKKIYQTAERYGIPKKDIIIDPLAMAVSSDDRAAVATLQTLRYIHDIEKGNTILGVSNVSFGLPERELITSTFFTMAMQNGLSAAIMNPNSLEMRKAHQCFCTLSGFDPQCSSYIHFAEGYQEEIQTKYGQVAVGVLGNNKSDGNLTNCTSSTSGGSSASYSNKSTGQVKENTVEYAIIHGLSTPAAEATKTLLATMEPLSIINEKLIPALDIVGKGFEEKKVYLPQLLMSAEAAKSAFIVIKEQLISQGNVEEKKGVIVLATVKGDIHDIGKNIVKVILDNYGYDVVDLGKDVDPQKVVDACIERHALLVGLSALMTTTVPSMAETIQLLKEQAPWAKTVVGGAVLTKEYAGMIHADYYAKDAMETVAVAKKLYQA